tara:strand:- start:7274 stop:7717 length:444 start_codon:yes stop_codon:yes gene_type:complete
MSKPVTCPCCGEELSSDYMSADPSRRRFFAALRDVHANLRPQHLQRWPNPEVMRKHALIEVGYCDAVTVACGSKTSAPQIANTFRLLNQYCVALVKGDVVTVFTARSMARRALQKKEFLQVADRVFGWLYDETGIDASKSTEGRAAA